MKVIKGDIKKINHIDGLEKSIVVVGTFDGLHTYHQKILREAEKISAKQNLQLVIVTFDKPVKAIFTGKDEKMIKNNEKIEYIQNYFAVDYYIELESNNNLINVDKMEFMVWLKEVLKTVKMIEGSDFTFGTDKEGTVDDLKEFFGEDNIIIFKRRSSVSSTKIHEYIANGNIEKANKHLFKPLKLFLNEGKSTVKRIEFPNIEIKPGYYESILNDETKATVFIADNNALSIVKINGEIEDDVNTVVLLKYLGKTFN